MHFKKMFQVYTANIVRLFTCLIFCSHINEKYPLTLFLPWQFISTPTHVTNGNDFTTFSFRCQRQRGKEGFCLIKMMMFKLLLAQTTFDFGCRKKVQLKVFNKHVYCILKCQHDVSLKTFLDRQKRESDLWDGLPLIEQIDNLLELYTTALFLYVSNQNITFSKESLPKS